MKTTLEIVGFIVKDARYMYAHIRSCTPTLFQIKKFWYARGRMDVLPSVIN